MEKRLPLFLILCFLVFTIWAQLFGPKPPERSARPAESGAPAEAGSADGAAAEPRAAEAPPPVGRVLADDAPRESGPLVFGAPGERARYWARFENRGARLVELRLGDYVDVDSLERSQRDDPEHWVRLVVPVETREGPTGSMLLTTQPSSRGLVRAEDLDEALWTMEVLRGPDAAPRGVEFRLAPGTGVLFVKRFLFEPGVYRFRVELELHNEAAGPRSVREFALTPVACMPPELDDSFYVEPQAVAAGPAGAEPAELSLASRDKVLRGGATEGPLQVPGPLAYAGVQNKYFAVLLREDPASDTAKRTLVGAGYVNVRDAVWAAAHPRDEKEAYRYVDARVNLELELPAEGESRTWAYEVYAGPKARDAFVGDFAAHERVLEQDLGFFSGIGGLLVSVLRLFERVTGNWGVAIILLTLCIRAALFPLNRRSQTAMARYQKKMKRVQPRIEELKKRYADDPQKLRQEQARIMQEEGAFPPLGGCLPMFVQIPIFIGLFSALRTSFDLRQAPFAGWITDLSRPDRLLELGLQVPLLVTTLDLSHLNLLPLLMVVLWVLQQRGMPMPADEQAARMQKMMTFMPIVMGVFLYNYAAGLSLYMITQSGLGIFEQKFIKKHWPIDDTEREPSKPKRGCGPFSGILENLAEKQKEHLKRVEAMQKKGGARSTQARRKRR